MSVTDSRQTDVERERDGEMATQTDRHTDRQIDGQTYCHICLHSDKNKSASVPHYASAAWSTDCKLMGKFH